MFTGLNVHDFIILDIFTGIKTRRFVNWPYLNISVLKYMCIKVPRFMLTMKFANINTPRTFVQLQ